MSKTMMKFTLMDPSIWEGRMFSEGWQRGANAAVEVTDKATGEAIGSSANASPDEVRQACLLAATAGAMWSQTPVEERARIVRRAGELLEQHSDEAIYWLVRESGSTRFKAAFEVEHTARHFENSAEAVTGVWKRVLKEDERSLSYMERVPLGVVGVIGPFNFPLLLGVRSLSAALAAGNTAVLKPSLNTAVCGGILIARVFEEAGLPAGVLHVLPGGGDAGAALADDPNVAMVAFTGSTNVGRKIGATAGAALKRVSLELGGKSPMLVLADADVEMAARAGAFGTFVHQGQACVATGLHLVPESLADEYCSRVAELAKAMKVGDPYTQEVALGPVINEKQRNQIDAIVKDAIEHGAELVEGGTYDGLFYRPTVLKNVPKTARAFLEEVFGPVAVIVTYTDEDEGIRLANGTGYGLSSAVFGELDHARTVAARIESGMVHINDQTVHEDARAPFGGMKASGNPTRIGGEADLEEYTTWRWVTETRVPFRYELTNS